MVEPRSNTVCAYWGQRWSLVRKMKANTVRSRRVEIIWRRQYSRVFLSLTNHRQTCSWVNKIELAQFFASPFWMPTSLVYAAASTNRFSQVADVSPSSSLIAFGSSSLIVLWDLEVRQILCLKNKVNIYLSGLRWRWIIKNSSWDARRNHLHSILGAEHLALYKRHWRFERLEKGNTSGRQGFHFHFGWRQFHLEFVVGK